MDRGTSEYLKLKVPWSFLTSFQVVEYITTQLLEGFEGGNEDVQAILNKYDFYVFPFVNPDGMI